MKLIPVKEVPEKRMYHPLQDIIKGFYESEDEIVRIDLAEFDYKHPRSCCSCFHIAVKKIRLPYKGNVS